MIIIKKKERQTWSVSYSDPKQKHGEIYKTIPIIYLRLLKKAIPAITGLSNRVALLVEPKVFVRDLGRTEGCELAVLRRELNVRRQRMRRKNLVRDIKLITNNVGRYCFLFDANVAICNCYNLNI